MKKNKTLDVSLPEIAELKTQWSDDQIFADLKWCAKHARKAVKESELIHDVQSPVMKTSIAEGCERIENALQELKAMVLQKME